MIQAPRARWFLLRDERHVKGLQVCDIPMFMEERKLRITAVLPPIDPSKPRGFKTHYSKAA